MAIKSPHRRGANRYRISSPYLNDNNAFQLTRCPCWCHLTQRAYVGQPSGTFKRGVTERGVFAFACQYIVSPRGRTGNRTVTQMRHPLLVEGRPNCARQSLASALSAPRVAATSYCHPGRHANVITPCLLTPCLNVPKTFLGLQLSCISGITCVEGHKGWPPEKDAPPGCPESKKIP